VVPLELIAATALPPPNWLKSTVAAEIVSLLLSPLAVLSQVAVTVSPILKAPLLPLAPLMLMFASVTVGAWLSIVPAKVPLVWVVGFPALSVAVMERFTLVVSIEPAVMV
jgi:hypothetical protein